MRKGILSAVAILTMGTGLTLGQGPMPGGPAGPGMPMGPMGPIGPMGPGMHPGLITEGGNPVIGPPGFEGMYPPGPPNVYNGGAGLLNGGGARSPRYWGSFDHVLWVSKGMPVGATLLTSGTPLTRGTLGTTGTTTLIGQERVDFGFTNGLRATVGFSLYEEERIGFEVGGFVMESVREQDIFLNTGLDAGLPLLAVPFANLVPPRNRVFSIVNPALAANVFGPALGIRNGGVVFENKSKVWSIDANYAINIYRNSESEYGGSLDFLCGARYFDLKEESGFYTRTFANGADNQFAGAAAFSGTVTTFDQFRVRNYFAGGLFGLRSEVAYGRLVLETQGKFALGYMRQSFNATGVSQRIVAGGPPHPTAEGGLFIQPGEGGTRYNHKFAFMPEGAMNVGVLLTPRLMAKVGYTFMWVNTVGRPGSNYDERINPNLVPTQAGTVLGTTFGGGPPTPVRDFRETSDYWLQGVNFGLEFRY